MHIVLAKLGQADAGDNEAKLMTKLAPEWVRTSDPVIRSPARYRWTTAPAILLQEVDLLLSHSLFSKDKMPLQVVDTGSKKRKRHALYDGGNYKRPALGLVTQWVKTAWDKIDNPMIQKSFLKCGISNALDGTEDDVLWEENVQPNLQPDSDSDDVDMDAGNEYYDNLMTDADIQTLFAESDDSDFEGFK